MRPYLLVLLLCVVMTALLSGCVLVAAGAGGTGGYYVGRDKRPVGQIVDDAAITAAINTKYIGDDTISMFDVDVDTYEGLVTLQGVVGSRKARDRAIELAREVKGVTDVRSFIEIVKEDD